MARWYVLQGPHATREQAEGAYAAMDRNHTRLRVAKLRDRTGPSLRERVAELEAAEKDAAGRAGRESACLVDTPEGLFLVQLGPTGVTVSSCAIPSPAPEPWTPVSAELEIPPPTLSELLEGASCAPWLSERAARLASSPAMVERAAAVWLTVERGPKGGAA